MFALTLRAVQEQKRDPFLPPAFIPRGDGMKATIVISPLRREFWTFFGLYTAKGENGQKRRPINKNRNPPLSERVAFVSASFCRSAVLRLKYIQAPLVCPKYGRWPKRTAKSTKMFIRSDEAPDRTDFRADCSLSPCEPYFVRQRVRTDKKGAL